MGPVLFILYINDIVRSSNLLNIIMYADDTILSFEGRNLSQGMQTMIPDSEKISLWLYRNQLTLSVLKTHYMVFHKPRIFHLVSLTRCSMKEAR